MRPVLAELIGSATARLTLCAPFISEAGSTVVVEARQARNNAELDAVLLTDLSARSIAAGSTDPCAVATLCDRIGSLWVVHLPRLHAKVYAADSQRAIVTSGNLTDGGMGGNYECGILVDEASLVTKIDSEIRRLIAISARLDTAAIGRLCEMADEARSAFAESQRSMSKAASKRLDAVLRESSDTLIRARLAEGPVHSVFGKTIEFLLQRHGPLTTKQLHWHIQHLHSDLCDDSIDRVIDGKRYGKKWKHAVRSAQQHLKRRGVVWHDGSYWRRVD